MVVQHVERRQTQIGFIGSIRSHGLLVSQPWKRNRNVVAGGLEDALDHRFHHFIDALLLRERHLEIDLGELRLPVGTQIFIAETTHDLEIFLVAAHHQQLLEDLRRLRQRVERTGLGRGWAPDNRARPPA